MCSKYRSNGPNRHNTQQHDENSNLQSPPGGPEHGPEVQRPARVRAHAGHGRLMCEQLYVIWRNKYQPRHTVRSLLSEKSFLLTHCHQIYIRKEISRPGFLNVNR
jgi:hypothetical protein